MRAQLEYKFCVALILHKARTTRITIRRLKSFSCPPSHAALKTLCVARPATSPPDARGRLGTITQNSGEQEHEDATCHGGARRRDRFAGLRTDRHAPRPGRRASLAVRPDGRSRGSSAAFGGAGHHGLRQQPLSRCRSRSERAPRSAPRLQRPRLLIAGSIFRKSGLPVFRRKCDHAQEHFPEKWTSGFPQKMRPRTTNPDAKPRATPGAFSCMGASDPSVVIARVIAAARARPDASVATTYFS